MIRFSGKFRSSLIVGLQGIRARKLRTLLPELQPSGQLYPASIAREGLRLLPADTLAW